MSEARVIPCAPKRDAQHEYVCITNQPGLAEPELPRKAPPKGVGAGRAGPKTAPQWPGLPA